MQPPQQPTPSSSMEGRVTNDVLDNLHAKSKAALDHETGYYRFFGPLFNGNYADLDPKILVFAYLQMSALEVRGQFDITSNDFRQFYALLAKAEDQTRAGEVREIATCAYKTAEARSQAQVRFLKEIAGHHGEKGFFNDLEDHCRLDWASTDKHQAEADHLRQGSKPAENRGTEQGEAGDSSSSSDDGPGVAVEPESSDPGSGSDGSE